MSYKRVVKKRGKEYGPYIYESYRDGEGNVKKRYLGKRNKLNFPFKLAGVVLLVTLLILAFYVITNNSKIVEQPLDSIGSFGSSMLSLLAKPFNFISSAVTPKSTGNAALNIDKIFSLDNYLSGTLKIKMKAGELIPGSSQIVVEQQGNFMEYLLSDIVKMNANGDYFVENKELNGSGEGFGFPGEIIKSPEVSFVLKVYSAEEGNGAVGGVNDSAGETPVAENITEIPTEQPAETPIEMPAEIPIESTEVQGNESSADSVLTSQVISEPLVLVDGQVSKEKEFNYILRDGETAEIVSGSVKSGEKTLLDSSLKLEISDGKAKVSTVYEEVDSGFGSAFLGSEEHILDIPLSDLKVPVQSGSLRIGLYYNGEKLAEAVKEVSLTGEINNLSVKKIAKEDNLIVNGTTVTTKQYRAVIGKPVKWIKKVVSENASDLQLEIPKEAENIVITTGEEVQVAEQQALQEQNAIESDKNALVTGEISLDIVKGEGLISKLLKWLRFRTGRVVSDADVQNAVSETGESKIVDLSNMATSGEVAVEYETPAPTAEEVKIDGGKQITISAADELGYTDVLAYSELDNSVSMDEKEKIKLYHVSNGKRALVKFDAYDLDENGMIDYIEWNVPHLSEQVYQVIIEISKAELLDENRNFLQDIYSQVREKDRNYVTIGDGNYVRVTFKSMLDSSRDITIYGKSASGAIVGVYERNGNDKIAEFNIQADKKYKVYLTGLQGSQDTFDLKVEGEIEIDYIVDPASVCSGTISGCSDLVVENACSAFGNGCSWASWENGNCSGDYACSSLDEAGCLAHPTCGTNYVCEGVGYDCSYLITEEDCDSNSVCSSNNLCTSSGNCELIGNIDDCEGSGCYWNGASCEVPYPYCSNYNNDETNCLAFGGSSQFCVYNFNNCLNSGTGSCPGLLSETSCNNASAIGCSGWNYVSCSGSGSCSGMTSSSCSINADIGCGSFTNDTGCTGTPSSSDCGALNANLAYCIAEDTNSKCSVSAGAIVLSEVSAVTTPTTDNTPAYTFNTDANGTASCGGSCSGKCSALGYVDIGNVSFSFDELADGVYSDCTVSVDSGQLGVSSFTVDTQGPGMTINSPSSGSYGITWNPSVSCSDSYSGCSSCEYHFDSDSNSSMNCDGSDITSPSSQGNHILYVHGIDGVGNIGSEASVSFTYESPSTEASAGSYSFGTWTNKSVLVTLTCTDSGYGGGCNLTYYCVDSGNSCSPSQEYSVPVSISTAGISYIRYYSLDNVGVSESVQYKEIKIDSTGPVMTINAPAAGSYVKSWSPSVTCSDSGSACSSCQYHFDSDSYSSMNCNGGNIPAPSQGSRILYVKGTDAVNNTGSEASVSFTYDTIAPVALETAGIGTTKNNTPGYSFQSNESGYIISCLGACSGYCSGFLGSALTANTGKSVIFSALPDGTYSNCKISLNDTAGNMANLSMSSFTIDATGPVISVISPLNGAGYSSSVVYFNLSLNENGTCVYSLNSGGINYSMTANSSGRGFNATNSNVADGGYSANFYCNDTAGNTGTGSSSFTVDTTSPSVSYGIGTENNNEVLAGGSGIYVNLSAVENNLANVTFSLYNSTSQVNSTVYTSASYTINWTGLSAGDYNYQVNITDSANNKNYTVLRNISLLSSCLSQCSESNLTAVNDCNITSRCYLQSSLCTNSTCDFRNFRINASLYVLNGASLDLNLSGNISFLGSGNQFIFSGKNGSSAVGGSLGGNAGTVNISVPNLFNTTNARFVGVGGYSTKNGIGGNGGTLVINMKGAIGALSAGLGGFESYVSIIAGSSSNSTSGNGGSIIYNKNIYCSKALGIYRDVDVNGDGVVDSQDTVEIENKYGNVSTDSTFNSTYDINCDNKLNVVEIAREGFEWQRGV